MSRSNPDLAPATNVAEACPVCGGPAEMDLDDEGWPIARCGPCKGPWLRLDIWNDSKLQLVPANEAPPLDTIKRADVPAIVVNFLKQAAPLIEQATALVVTDASQVAEMKEARDLRLAIRDMRLVVKKTHKEIKAGILEQTREIDKLLRVVDRFEALEKHLEQQEQFEARQLADAKMRFQQEREDMLRPYVSQADLLQIAVGLAEIPETAFLHMRDGYEIAYVGKQKRDEQERVAAEEAERLRKLEVQRLTNELAQAETERLQVAEVARREQARLQAIADAAELEARTIREEQARLASARQAAQQATDAQKLESIAQRLSNPQWPEMSEPWAHDIIHDEHVRLILAGLAVWIRGQVKAHQPKSNL